MIALMDAEIPFSCGCGSPCCSGGVGGCVGDGPRGCPRLGGWSCPRRVCGSGWYPLLVSGALFRAASVAVLWIGSILTYRFVPLFFF